MRLTRKSQADARPLTWTDRSRDAKSASQLLSRSQHVCRFRRWIRQRRGFWANPGSSGGPALSVRLLRLRVGSNHASRYRVRL